MKTDKSEKKPAFDLLDVIGEAGITPRPTIVTIDCEARVVISDIVTVILKGFPRDIYDNLNTDLDTPSHFATVLSKSGDKKIMWPRVEIPRDKLAD